MIGHVQSTTTGGESGFQPIMRKGLPPDQVTGKPAPPPPKYAMARENGLLIERNIAVRLRDGVRIYVDVYRADGAAGTRDLPVIIGWSPYGKHYTSDRLAFPGAGVEPGWISKYTAFEAPDPAYWCPRGYAVLYADPRGTWYSEGEMHHGGIVESQDCCELIEWAGVQPWSNGKVGLSGVSYLATIAWQVAPLKPPHLAAINPWEGFSDWYRELGYHGGIRETGFVPRATANLNWSTTRTEDTDANMRAHPLYDAYWESKQNDLEGIECPAFVVASWSDQGLHTRGTLEAFKRMRSRDKWLEVHGRKKWAYYYDPANVEKLRQFFDCFLKGTDRSFLQRPRVCIEVRERAYVGEWRDEQEWPLARQQLRKLWLDASREALVESLPGESAEVRYDPLAEDGRAVFEHTFEQDTEITGHMKLRLWVEAVGSDDMDVFVALQKYDRDGQTAPFVFYATLDNGPVALGWLRASHRELDAARSRPEQPWHPHTREQRLQPGVPVPLDIEIWPSSTKFAAGEGLRVVVRGQDIYQDAPPGIPFARHQALRNQGTHVIRTGGPYDSHLLYPLIPPRA